MTLLKRMSISLLTLLCSANLMANNCLPYDKCCDKEPTFCSLDGFSLRAEGLYLWAGESDLQFGAITHYAQSQSDGLTVTRINSKYKTPSFNDQLGYRVGLDYLDPCSCAGFSLTYFHFKTHANGKIYSPANAALSGKIGSETTYVNPLFAMNAKSNSPFNECSANLKLQVNLLDFDFGRTFCYSSCFNFRPFIGVRYADISEYYRIRSSGIVTNSDRASTSTTEYSKLKDGFTGFGIHAGFDSDWTLCYGFSLYGKAAGSLLYGHNHRTSFTDYLQNDFTNAIVNDAESYTKANQHGPKAIFELGIGIKWDYCLCKNQTIGLKLGWEQLLFLNNNRFENSIFGEKGVSYAFSRHGDLGLQGIVFGANYAF